MIEDNRIDNAMDRIYRFKLPSTEERNKVATNYLLRKAYTLHQTNKARHRTFYYKGRDGY